MKDETLNKTPVSEPELPAAGEPAAAAELLSEGQETPAEHIEKVEAVHHWIDDVFSGEQKRLNHDGVSDPKVWVKGMAAIDRALSEHPLETLEYLAKVYGVTFPVRNENINNVSPELAAALQKLHQNQQQLWQALLQQGEQTHLLAISAFVSAKDDNGVLLHPHFSAVKDDMFALLRGGAALDFENAYEKALWLNPQTREQLITKQNVQNLQTLAAEAEKAKTAGFSPRGKLEKEDYSKLTTREILERKFKELGD